MAAPIPTLIGGFLDPMSAVRSLQDIYLAFSILCQRANVLFSGSWQMTK